MPGSKSEAWEVDVLKMATGQATSIIPTTPITPYLALFTGVLTGDSPGAEATGGGYARVTTAGKWAAPVSGAGTVTNNAAINFAAFSGTVSSGAPFTHFGLLDSLTGGNALYFGDLTDQTKSGLNGDTITFVPGSLVITEG
jgi:hypothetical protein